MSDLSAHPRVSSPDWQPIETAPQKRDVLLRRYGLPPIVAGWFERHNANGDWFTFEDPHTPVRGELTHWMPIPELVPDAPVSP